MDMWHVNHHKWPTSIPNTQCLTHMPSHPATSALRRATAVSLCSWLLSMRKKARCETGSNHANVSSQHRPRESKQTRSCPHSLTLQDKERAIKFVVNYSETVGNQHSEDLKLECLYCVVFTDTTHSG